MGGGLDISTITVGGFNVSLSTIDKPTRQKINKDMEELNNSINPQDLIFVEHFTR